MNKDNIEAIRERVLSLIDSRYESDASFERALSLNEKTVNNWRRGRSASFMKILPTLSELFGVNIGELLDIPLRKDTSELSEEELHLLHLYRRSATLPPKMRDSLRKTLEMTIEMYTSSLEEAPTRRGKKK